MKLKVVSVGLSVAVSVGTHVVLGWMGSLSGPLLAGLLIGRSGQWYGGLTLATAWAVLMAWNLLVAFEESLNMMETTGALLGGMPGFIVPVAGLLVSFALGLAAGGLGSSIKPEKAS
ncbi:MAG: hypothetical protein ACO3NR_02975 [Rhodothermales bacterium]